jgi:carbonic anhydrase/acetyltransferase-like protein (isoleucine patch superfamily)
VTCMKVYIIKSRQRVYPFDDQISDTLVANRTLLRSQVASVRKAGCEAVIVEAWEQIKEQGAHVVFLGHVCISAEALRRFLQLAQGQSESFGCAIDNQYYIDSYLWHLKPDSRNAVPIELYYLVKRESVPVRSKILRFTAKKFERERMPRHMERNGKGFDQPLTNIVLLPIHNWVNLWQANIAMLMALAYELEFTKRYRQLIPLLRAMGSMNRAPRYMNKIGKNCTIDPSAVVEASVIGDNVHIGANAVVRLAVVGNDAYISDQALLRVCVVGEEAYIANNNNLAFVVAYPRSFLISGPYQFSIFGSDSAVMHCIDCDCRLDGWSVKAKVSEDLIVDTKQNYLGSCFGHRVRIGAGTICTPGSAILNDLWINPNPELLMREFSGKLVARQNLFLVKGKIVSKEHL